MRLEYGQRSVQGFLWEDKIASRLRRMGHDVLVMARNNRYDLLVNQSIRVDVKSISYTEYKGSDGYPIRGWVCSNMSNPPTCDYYVIVCLDKTRTQEVKTYVIPATLLLQTSLTITSKDRFANYINAYHQFNHMKISHTQPVGFNNRGEANKEDEYRELNRFRLIDLLAVGSSVYIQHRMMSHDPLEEKIIAKGKTLITAGRQYFETRGISFSSMIGEGLKRVIKR